MGKINMGKVVVGGLLAGVVLNAFDFVVNGVVLKADWDAAMAAMSKPAMGGSTIGIFVALDFLVGILMVWVYAAIRPRFGAGAGTAVKAGLIVWALCSLVPTMFFMPMHFFPDKLVWVPLIGTLIWTPIAAVAGAWPYQEA